jgi:hypothetical protein
MTTFVFIDRKSKKEMTFEGTIAEAESFEKINPQLEWLCSAPLIHSGSGMKKPDQGFRDVLRTIKKGNSRGLSKSNMNTF